MTEWLDDAIRYVKLWLDYQVRATQLPGCSVAIAKGGVPVAEFAFGTADLSTGAPMTPEHRFRVASHSKSFTAAGIMKLREAGRLHLDQEVGTIVPGLHETLASATIEELLSHSAGVNRDGSLAMFWQNAAPFLDAAALRAELGKPATLAASTRFKYSNLGFSLLGLVIETLTAEPYAAWIAREIVAPLGLSHTVPDVPLSDDAPMASGHSGMMPFGRRPVDGGAVTNAMVAATGFVSTAGDLARFYASLSPTAEESVLSVASRRAMIRPRWPIPKLDPSRGYGLGTLTGKIGEHAWFGHSGGFPGFITRTACVPDWGVSVSLLTNAIDGPAGPWVDGILAIFRKFEEEGAGEARVADWFGRWWTLWGVADLVPMGDRVLIADPGSADPFAFASELDIHDATSGTIAFAPLLSNHGEPVRRKLEGGAPVELQLGAMLMTPEPRV